MTSPSSLIDDRYELVERLTRTSMAEVWRAVDRHTGQAVAVKLVDDRLAADPGFSARFRREAQSAAALNHPNLVRVLDYGRTDERFYLVEELIDGPSLERVLQVRTPLPVNQALAIAAQAAAGVAAAHSTGIVHRDIRPSTIQFRGDGVVKVSDLALARAASRGSLSDASLTDSAAGYMSPEQAQGGELSPASDVYALGVLLFEMLTGHVPFEAATPLAVAMRQANEEPPSPRAYQPELSGEEEALVLRALARQPGDRFPDAGALRAAIFRLPQFDPDVSLVPLAALRPARPVFVPPPPPPPPPPPTAETTGGFDGEPPVAATVVEPERTGPRRGEVLTMAAFIIAGLLLGVAAVFAVRSLPQLASTGNGPEATATPQTVIVPNLVGHSLDDARRIADEQGLTVTPEERPDPGAAPGTVIDQEPPAGRTARSGSPLRLIVAVAPVSGTVPNLQGLTLDDARSMLARAGLTVGETSERASLPEHLGRVVGQSPPAGTTVPPNTSVELFLGDGSQPALTPAPAATITATPTPRSGASPTPVPATPTPQRTPAASPTTTPTRPAGATPTATAGTPGATTATPAGATPTPTGPTPTPGAATATPAAATATPGGATPTPAGATPTPAAATPTPGGATATPAGATPTPAAATPTPAPAVPTATPGAVLTPSALTPAPATPTPASSPAATATPRPPQPDGPTATPVPAAPTPPATATVAPATATPPVADTPQPTATTPPPPTATPVASP